VVTPSEFPTRVIDFVLNARFEDLPDHVVRFAQRCLLDLLGVAAAGRTTELSSIISQHATSHFGGGLKSAPILFDGRLVSPVGAALANGMTIDSIDAHDGHKITKGHTGCHQLPALMAFSAAEHRDDPRAFLADLVVGYEFATRVGIALHATVPDYHTSGAWGAVGCAALGARILGLDPAPTFEAMGIAEYHGPRSQMMRVIDHPTMLKDGSGWGAMAGVSAAYLAAEGFTGSPAVTVNDPEIAWVWDDIGARWLIEDQYFKPHPVCRWAQPAVEAALSLCRTHSIGPADVERVEVSTFHEAVRLATSLPETTEEAQYSLPFPVAAAIVRGRLGPLEIGAAALADDQIRAISTRVSIVEDVTHNSAFPQHRFARVAIRLTDGRTVVSDDTEPRGDPEAHLSDREIRDKFSEFATPVLGAERTSAIEEAVDQLPEANSLTTLLDLIVAPL